MAAMGMSPGMKDITQEEVSKLTKAMKSEEFRGHMDEYCKEISDPHNRKEYLQYLEQLEAKGEMPEGQQLLRCQPGCCVKTWICFKNGQTQKCFINIVHSERLEDVTMERSDKGDGHKVQLPYSLSPPRPDRDSKDQYCMTCDFAVSSRTFHQAMQYPNYLKMIVDTAADGLSSHHLKGNEEVKKDYKVMQRMACKGGAPMPMSVRAELLRDRGAKPTKPQVKLKTDAVTPAELQQMRNDYKQKKSSQEQEDSNAEVVPQERQQAQEAATFAPRIRVPQHKLVHSGILDLADYMETDQISMVPASIPKVLKLSVEVPTVKRVGDINLEVTSTNVVVEVPDKYYLDLPLPYEIQETRGTAKFEKTKQVLNLELPVVPKPQAPKSNFFVSRENHVDTTRDAGDGALSEGEGLSDEDLPPLEDPQADQCAVPPVASDADAVAQPRADAPTPVPEALAGASGPTLAPSAAVAAGPPAAAVPERPLLELASQGGALCIASTVGEPAEPAAEALDHRIEDTPDNCPAFVAADSFEGARPGYYFTLGDRGLGYYLDRRQPRPGGTKPLREVKLPGRPAEGLPKADANAGPLVSEVETPAALPARAAVPQAPAVPEAPEQVRRKLPQKVQRYLDATSALTSQISAAALPKAADVPEEPSVEWAQNMHNLMLFIDIPDCCEAANMQVTLRGQRLSLTFCTRPRAGQGQEGEEEQRPWRCQLLRRVLCGLVDARQWHAAPPTRPGAQLVVVLRKVDLGIWGQMFDAKATFAPEPCNHDRDALGAATVPGRGAATSSSRREQHGEGGLGLEPADQGLADAPPDDSAELDAAPPLTEEAVGAGAMAKAGSAALEVAKLGSGGGEAREATEAMIQSAIVMGQGVPLRTRLMYELF